MHQTVQSIFDLEYGLLHPSMNADGLDGNGLQIENLRLNFSSCFHMSISIHKLRSHLPLDVRR